MAKAKQEEVQQETELVRLTDAEIVAARKERAEKYAKQKEKLGQEYEAKCAELDEQEKSLRANGG